MANYYGKPLGNPNWLKDGLMDAEDASYQGEEEADWMVDHDDAVFFNYPTYGLSSAYDDFDVYDEPEFDNGPYYHDSDLDWDPYLWDDMSLY